MMRRSETVLGFSSSSPHLSNLRVPFPERAPVSTWADEPGIHSCPRADLDIAVLICYISIRWPFRVSCESAEPGLPSLSIESPS